MKKSGKEKVEKKRANKWLKKSLNANRVWMVHFTTKRSLNANRVSMVHFTTKKSLNAKRVSKSKIFENSLSFGSQKS